MPPSIPFGLEGIRPYSMSIDTTGTYSTYHPMPKEAAVTPDVDDAFEQCGQRLLYKHERY